MTESIIESTAQGKFWIGAMTGVILLTPNPGLASEQGPTDLLPGLPELEEGEPKTKPAPPLEAKPWPLALPQPALENPNQGVEAADQLDTALIDQSRDQPREQPEDRPQGPGAEISTNALASLDQSPPLASTVAADVDGDGMLKISRHEQLSGGH